MSELPALGVMLAAVLGATVIVALGAWTVRRRF